VEIVTKILAANKKDKITKALESLNVSNLVSKFSIQNYKDNLKHIIQSSSVEQGAEEVVILSKDKRPPKVQ
jgi:site-specific recombinase XerC